MIRDIILGDITASQNKADIIIGMNTALKDVTGIGLPFVKDVIPMRKIQLGSVVSFEFDSNRKLHMIICHKLGVGGWVGAERYVRFGLDYLEHVDYMDRHAGAPEPPPKSIVQIGTGRVGTRDGADFMAIRKAMMDNHLVVDLFLFEKERVAADVHAALPALRPSRVWSPDYGETRIPVAAAA